jgi:hypothetical protein
MALEDVETFQDSVTEAFMAMGPSLLSDPTRFVGTIMDLDMGRTREARVFTNVCDARFLSFFSEAISSGSDVLLAANRAADYLSDAYGVDRELSRSIGNGIGQGLNEFYMRSRVPIDASPQETLGNDGPPIVDPKPVLVDGGPNPDAPHNERVKTAPEPGAVLPREERKGNPDSSITGTSTPDDSQDKPVHSVLETRDTGDSLGGVGPAKPEADGGAAQLPPNVDLADGNSGQVPVVNAKVQGGQIGSGRSGRTGRGKSRTAVAAALVAALATSGVVYFAITGATPTGATSQPSEKPQAGW